MVDNSLNSMIAQGYGPTADWSKAQQNALSNVMGIQKVQGNQLAMEDALQEMEMRPMKNEMEALKYMEEVAPKIPWETWDASRDWMIKRNKINPNLLPDRSWFDQQAQNNGVDTRTYFDFWKNNYWIPGTQRTQMELKRMELAGKAPEVKSFQEGDEVVEKQWNGQEWVEVSRGKKWNPAEKPETSEAALTDTALHDPDPAKREKARQTLEFMQKRKIETAQAMPVTPLLLGNYPSGEPVITGGTKGKPIAQPLPTTENKPILPKDSEILSENDKKIRSDLGNAKALVTELKSMWDAIAPESRMGGAALWAEAKTGSNPQAKLYIDQRKAFLGVLSRSIAAERGVLTDRDIERIDAALAKIGADPFSNDTKEEAALKWGTIERILNTAEERWQEGLKIKTKKEASVKSSQKDVEQLSDDEILNLLE